MSDSQGDDPLARLGRRIDEAQSRRSTVDPPSGTGLPKSAMGAGFRVGVELVAALVVGLGFGWVIDGWLGTRPLAMVAFFFLGAAAGMLNVWRAMGGLGRTGGGTKATGQRPGKEERQNGGG